MAGALLRAPMTVTSEGRTVSGRRAGRAVGALAVCASTTRRFPVPVGLLTLGLPCTVAFSRSGGSPVDPNTGNDAASLSCTVVASLLVDCS